MTALKVDIHYLKKTTEAILNQVKETNGTVRNHDTRLTKMEGSIKSHFHLHKVLDKLSRGQVVILIAIANGIAIFGAVILAYLLTGGG